MDEVDGFISFDSDYFSKDFDDVDIDYGLQEDDEDLNTGEFDNIILE